MKSTLMKLKEKTKTWLSPRHPFYAESLSFRENYAAAILLQTQLSQEVTPMDHFELLRLFTFGLHFGRDEVKRVIALARNRERVLDTILEMLDTKEKQTVFLLDLYNMSYTGQGFGERESEAVQIYGELFHVPHIQMRLLQQLIQEAMQNHAAECMKLYSNMMQLKMSCTLEQVRYYIPELSYTTVFDVHAVYPGQRIVINGRCELREEVRIPEGCELCIQNADVSFAAPVYMEGGRLDIIDSELKYVRGEYEVMLQIHGNSTVTLSGVQVYCRNHCGFLEQQGGNLRAEQLSVYESNRQSAVSFEGASFQMTDSHFQDCYCIGRGAALNVSAKQGTIRQCQFRQCLAQQGGALYGTPPVRLEGCVFAQCHAMDLGNAVYYKGLAQGLVQGCIYEDLLDERRELVQEINEDRELEGVSELTLSTCFTQAIRIPQEQALYVHDVQLYLGGTLTVPGGLTVEHSVILAHGTLGKDLLNVCNASPVFIRDTTLDGMEQHGIMKATGTKVTLRSCLFKNAAKGRAVYNSVDLLCEDTVFSNCLDGAIYGSRAVIRQSSFINCRSDTGAGVYLVGSKGLIRGCTFARCIARKSGGAISVFGNYPVSECEFIE